MEVVPAVVIFPMKAACDSGSHLPLTATVRTLQGCLRELLEPTVMKQKIPEQQVFCTQAIIWYSCREYNNEKWI